MMIRHIWSVFAGRSIVDNDTQLVSIYDVVDTLNIQGTKSDIVAAGAKMGDILQLPVQSEVVSMFQKLDSKVSEGGMLRLELIDPSGKSIAKHSQDILVEKDFLRTRLKLNGLTVTKKGIYEVHVSLKGTEDEDFYVVAQIPFMVNLDIK